MGAHSETFRKDPVEQQKGMEERTHWGQGVGFVQKMAHGPVTAASRGSLLGMQNVSPHPQPTKPEAAF